MPRILVFIPMVCLAAVPAVAHPSFSRIYVDTNYGGNGKPGWVRSGDLDEDGDVDLLAGGGGALFSYENDGQARGWTRYGSLDGTGNMGANGAILFDVDGDQDLDVVCAKYNGDLGWWEHPGGTTLSNATWTFHVLYVNSGWYVHDFERLDLDGDGVATEFVVNLNAGYYNADIKILWFTIPADPTQPWNVNTLEPNRNEGTPHGHAGMDVGDIDGDGDQDYAYANGWYERDGAAWTWHEITTFYGVSNTQLYDMDGDGRLDLLLSAGHHGDGVRWYRNPADPVNDAWPEHVIDNAVVHPEGLAIVDFDRDRDPDVIASELFFGEAPGEPDWSDEAHNIYFYENQGGSTNWVKWPITTNSYPSHLLRMADINLDGNLDIISEGAGYQVVSYYENEAAPICDVTQAEFTLQTVDPAYGGNGRPGWSTAGDLDGDGAVDIVSGGGGALQWYQAPTWTRRPIETPSDVGGNGGVLLDVDGDADLDLVAARFNGDLTCWLNPGGTNAIATWPSFPIDSAIATFNHDLVAGNLDGDPAQELVALYVDGGVYWYDPPADPANDPWPRTRILGFISDPYVGLALGDLDRDGDLDVVASSSWYQNPPVPTTPDWAARPVFAAPVQNLFCIDVNRDGRTDVVGAQGFVYPTGEVRWAETPIDPTTQAFVEHVVAVGLDGPENLWVGDLNNDLLPEIVTGEMGTSTGFGDGDSSLLLYSPTDIEATNWTGVTLATNVGVSARIRAVDIDGDGDTDFTADGNAEDHIYLWQNTSPCVVGSQAGQVAAVQITPAGGSFADTVEVTLTTATPGASIYYTLDGSIPDETSAAYAGPFLVDASMTVKARAFLLGLDPSPVTAAVFLKEQPGTLLYHWPMEAGTGTMASNVVLTGFHGQLAGPSWSTDTFACSSQALSFDGADDVVELGHPDVGGDALTISAWIKADDFDIGDARIVSKATDGIAVQDHYWMVSTDLQSGDYVLRFRLKTDDNTDTLLATGATLTTGVWTHVAAVYDGSTMKLYQDGSEVGSMTKTGGLATDASVPAAIGNQPGSENKPFDGLIDEVQIYSRALSPADIVVLANPETGCTPLLSPYEAWIAGFAGSHLIAGTASDADLDGDGCLNLWEWSQGGNPAVNDCVQLQPSAERIGGQIRYSYYQHASGIVYEVQASTNLVSGNWQPVAGIGGSGTNALHWQEFPMADHVRRYFRMRVR